MLTIKNLSLYKRRRQNPLLQEISMEFPRGSITLLLGKSGAGKSSLLRCLAHLETAYEGEILFHGKSLKELPAAKRACCLSYIAQSYALFPPERLEKLQSAARSCTRKKPSRCDENCFRCHGKLRHGELRHFLSF